MTFSTSKLSVTEYAYQATQAENENAKIAADPLARLAQNAVTKTSINELALNRARVALIDKETEIKLDTCQITDQQRSGRCWIFAATNLLRLALAKRLNLETFDFSQTFVHFYDKLEKANTFLAAMVELHERPLDDRLITHLLNECMGDGGYWQSFVNIVNKYGIVPAQYFKDTESSQNTDQMNKALVAVLMRAVAKMRQLDAPADTPVVTEPQLLKIKQEAMLQVQRILNIHLGTPPTSFVFQLRDKDKKFRRLGTYTPKSFAAEFLPNDLAEYVVLASDPRPQTKLHGLYEIEWSTNMIEGKGTDYVKLSAAELKRATLASLQAGEPVWFGCDVANQHSNELGMWAADLYDYESVYGVPLEIDKTSAVILRKRAATHAMLFVGVDYLDNTPATSTSDDPQTQKANNSQADSNRPVRAWRVENSWGKERGVDGFYTMDDSWFDPYVFSVAVHPRVLPDDLREVVEKAQQEPAILLPAWDIMY